MSLLVAQRFQLILGCLLGCLLGLPLGLLAAIEAGLPGLALGASCLLPAAGCYAAGLRRPPAVAKVAFLAAVGWALTYALEPQVSESWASHWRRVEAAPFAGHGWLVVCGAVSSLLAVVGASFAPTRE